MDQHLPPVRPGADAGHLVHREGHIAGSDGSGLRRVHPHADPYLTAHGPGVRGERETRELIVRENRRYAKRQLIWFRKEPNLRWIHAAGQRDATLEEVARALAAMESVPDGPADT